MSVILWKISICILRHLQWLAFLQVAPFFAKHGKKPMKKIPPIAANISPVSFLI